MKYFRKADFITTTTTTILMKNEKEIKLIENFTHTITYYHMTSYVPEILSQGSILLYYIFATLFFCLLILSELYNIGGIRMLLRNLLNINQKRTLTSKFISY